MSETHQQGARTCVTCGIDITGTNAAAFDCPQCGTRVHRCGTCRTQSNLYECPGCGFTGP